MSKKNSNKIYLQRDGTSQSGRFPEALSPSSVEIEDRSLNDWIEYLYEYAALLQYIDENGQANGDWQSFIKGLKDHVEKTGGYPEGHMPAHQSLIYSFLSLLESHREQLNGLTREHLDAYFKQVLQLEKAPPRPDEVHVLFDLKKNSKPALIKAGSLLKAGKDSLGKELLYSLDEDVIVNDAEVEKISSILFPEEDNGIMHRADQTNSSDGEGGTLPEEDPSWPPFGTKANKVAEPGFALASPILWLQEGTRTIKVAVWLNGSPEIEDLEDALRIYLTGSEGWMGPFLVTPQISVLSGGISKMEFSVELGEADDAVTFYNRDLHAEGWETLSPLMKVLINADAAPDLFLQLRDIPVSEISIDVDVKGMKDLVLENDQGAVDPAKPFTPFGSEPVKGSSFYIGCEEAFNKNLDQFTLKADWMDVPAGNMSAYYGSSYTAQSGLNYTLGGDAFRANILYRNRSGDISSREVGIFKSSNNRAPAEYTISNRYVIANFLPVYHIQTSIRSFSKKKLTPVFHKRMSNLPNVNLALKIRKAMLTYRPKNLRSGFVKMELLHDFLHRQYRRIYTQAVAAYSHGQGGVLYLPKEPYTPLMKSITLDYQASTSRVSIHKPTEEDYLNREIELYQLGPHGYRDTHPYLTSVLPFETDNLDTLVPAIQNQGELYIGLKNAFPGTGISLLVQVADGSADPLKDKEEVTWSVLSGDRWQRLDDHLLIADNTDGLLKSGIVRIILPVQLASDNKWIGEDLTWIRAAVKENPDAVCRIIGIHTSAAKAVFSDHNNAPDHLGKPLPSKRISKLKVPVEGIKKVEQPYASFGGQMSEKPSSYYTRVSERLRHKNRAVTIFDYERLVLQKFPEVYKVKCLPHASPSTDMAPGHTTLILVPDLQNRNAVNKLQPRVSKAMLEDVRKYLAGLKSHFAVIHTENPSYEPVRLDFKVKFHRNYEFGYYREKLNSELVEFMSPWSSGKSVEITFGGRISKSTLIRFVEERPYVDFVTDVKMVHLAGPASEQRLDRNEVSALSQRSVLVSHPNHIIKSYDD